MYAYFNFLFLLMTIPTRKRIQCVTEPYVYNTITYSAQLKPSVLKKYKSCHEDASATGTSTDSKIVPFAVDALGNFCSVSIMLLKELCKSEI